MIAPDHADGGWTYVGPPRRTQADKNRAKKDRKKQRAAAQEIPLADAGGIRVDYRKARVTSSRRNRKDSDSEYTDSVSTEYDDQEGTVPLEGGQSSELSVSGVSLDAPISQAGSLSATPVSPSFPSLPLGSSMDLDEPSVVPEEDRPPSA
jgi:hypothetical protein